MNMTKLSAGVVGFGNAVLIAILGVGDVDWSDAKKGVAFLVLNTTVAMGLSLYAHLRPDTTAEPVAVAVAFPVWTESLLAVVVAFDVWHLTAPKAVLLQGVVLAAVALVTGALARSVVTPLRKKPVQ